MKIPEITHDGGMASHIQTSEKKMPQAFPVAGSQIISEIKVDRSPESIEMEKIRDILVNTPDIRSERVDALKTLVDSGKYVIKSDELASKIIKDFLAEMNS